MPQPFAFSSTEIEPVFSRLHSSPRGLSAREVRSRQTEYGPNILSEKRHVSAFHIYASQFANSLIITLLVAAALIFLVWYFGDHDRADIIEGSLIIGIVFLITLLGFVQEYRAERAVEALKKLLAFEAKIIRDGKELIVPVRELVPGDVVILEEGEKVPADMRLFDVAELQVNEASLTGESVPVVKEINSMRETTTLGDQKNMAFSGTIVSLGRGKGIVTTIGDSTEIGKIAQAVAEVKEEATPIQLRLDRISKIMGIGVLALSAIVFIFIMFFSQEFADQTIVERLLHSGIAAIALAVAAIPEGLPAVVTISLALGTQRMLKRNALVRKLNSIETLGSTDVICADKTGTLTKGEMTVQELYVNAESYQVSGTGYDTEGQIRDSSGKINLTPELKLLLRTGGICNNAQLTTNNKIIGDPTEASLLISAQKGGVDIQANRIDEIPFSSTRKAMSVVIEEKGKATLYSKGAPEIILAKCNRYIHHGKIVTLKQSDRTLILKQTEKMSQKALRTLGFAYKPLHQKINDHKSIEADLTFIGLQGMIDPAREEVKGLVAKCHGSGIRIIMVTGDHAATAEAVAHDIGITGASVTGQDLANMSKPELSKSVALINIFARVNPDTKMKIVTTLEAQGHIVAMTGDGVNDAPAMKSASIGIAMGKTGTDVAKEASDMVLLDDRFATIIAAVEEGRGVFENIRKFVAYLLSCNIGEVIVVFVAVALFHHVPLTATMLLWINIITDGFPAVALGMDPARRDILHASPSEFQKEIITPKIWLEMVVFGVLLTCLVLSVYIVNLPEGEAEARAAAFTAVVVCELVRVLQIRHQFHNPFWSNLWLLGAVIISFILHLVLLFVPFFANLFGLAPLDVSDWLYIFGGTVAISLFFEGLRGAMLHLSSQTKKNTSIKIAPS